MNHYKKNLKIMFLVSSYNSLFGSTNVFALLHPNGPVTKSLSISTTNIAYLFKDIKLDIKII